MAVLAGEGFCLNGMDHSPRDESVGCIGIAGTVGCSLHGGRQLCAVLVGLAAVSGVADDVLVGGGYAVDIAHWFRSVANGVVVPFLTRGAEVCH